MANLRFSADWTSTLTGDLAQGEKLAIEFDPQRLPQCRLNWRGAEIWDISGYARFHPSGEVFSGSLLQRIASSSGIVTTLQPIPWEVSVPFDATQVELWFHNFYQVSSRCDAWDSRFGQNYWFDVAQRGPTQPVIYRAGASPRLDMVNAFEVAVTKRKHFFPGTGPGAPAGSEFQTVLTVKAWVRNIAYDKFVWVHTHVFDGADALVQAATFPLQYFAMAGGDGDFFVYDDKIYQGSGGGSGMGGMDPAGCAESSVQVVLRSERRAVHRWTFAPARGPGGQFNPIKQQSGSLPKNSKKESLGSTGASCVNFGILAELNLSILYPSQKTRSRSRVIRG